MTTDIPDGRSPSIPAQNPAISDAVVEAAIAELSLCLDGFMMEHHRPRVADFVRLAISVTILVDREDRSDAIGWLYHNEDTGEEFSRSHPIESGEVPDATRVRPATADALLELLTDAWSQIEDARSDAPADREASRAEIDRLKAELAEARADLGLEIIELTRERGEARADAERSKSDFEKSAIAAGKERAEVYRLTQERDAAISSLSIAEQATRTALESIPIAMTAAVNEALEVLRPFAKPGSLFQPRERDGYDMLVYAPAAGREFNICGDDLRAASAFVDKHSSRGEGK